MKEAIQSDVGRDKTSPTRGASAFPSSLSAGMAQLGIIFAFIAMVVVFSALRPQVFLSVENMTNIVKQTATISVVAFGMTIVMLAGGIDLSVGSIVAMCGVVAALLLGQGMPIPVAVIAALALGVAFGWVNGLVSVRWRIQPFLVTLGSMSVARGLALILSGGKTVYIDNKPFLNLMGRGNIGPIPVLLIWTLVFLVFSWALISRSTYGRRVRAVGGNEIAARQSGVRVGRVKIIAFMLSGFLSGFAALMMAGRLSSGLPSVGVGMELDAITAAVLGGTGFAGEGGSMIGTIFGALVLGTITTGLTILGVDPYVQLVVRGIVIVLAVILASSRR